MMMTPFLNPFGSWGESTRRLHDRFVIELNSDAEAYEYPMTPQSATFIGALISLEMACYRMARRLHRLERHDPKAFEALVRAMEKGS